MKITGLNYNKTNNIGTNSKRKTPISFNAGILVTAKEGKKGLMSHSVSSLNRRINGGLNRILYIGRRIVLIYSEKATPKVKRMANIYDKTAVKGDVGMRFEFIENDTLNLILSDLYGHWDLN